MVSRLKVGRLLLGGDAAHIHSPAGAQAHWSSVATARRN
jgi:2-polyprenyl-6-methoxyphenol hydroxylase-like FAD-dependent oxidoreductase